MIFDIDLSPCHFGVMLVVLPLGLDAGEVRVTTPFPTGTGGYQATAIVTNDAGDIVSGLTTDRFLVAVDQHETVAHEVFPVTNQWMAVALLIDRSGSMRGDPLDAAQEAASDFVQRCGPQTLYVVVPFDDSPVPEAHFKQKGQGVLSAISEIEVGNDTSLYDAILMTMPHLASYWPPRKAMIALTDGKDTKSTSRYEDVLSRLRDWPVPVYTIGLGIDLEEDKLDSMARATGGRFFHAPTPADLVTLYRTIAAELDHGYVVRFDLPSDSSEMGAHVLEITVAADEEVITGRQLFDMMGEPLDQVERILQVPTGMASPGSIEAASPLATVLLGIGIGLAAGAGILFLLGKGDIGARIVFASLSALLGGLVGALYRFM